MTIRELLAKNPSLVEILEYVDKEAQRIASERKLQSHNSLNSSVMGGD
ncbi:MAG: hypothetical protein PHH85_12620 [Candidatus Methanoperedens sp.]|nr:hypothetical protein [Candidatus Methanoperedens sp.]